MCCSEGNAKIYTSHTRCMLTLPMEHVLRKEEEEEEEVHYVHIASKGL